MSSAEISHELKFDCNVILGFPEAFHLVDVGGSVGEQYLISGPFASRGGLQ